MSKQCPLTYLQDECIESKCQWWLTVAGKNKVTGEEGTKQDCAVNYLVTGLFENALETRGTNAGLDKINNRMAKDAEAREKGLMAPATVQIANALTYFRQRAENNGDAPANEVSHRLPTAVAEPGSS